MMMTLGGKLTKRVESAYMTSIRGQVNWPTETSAGKVVAKVLLESMKR
jgi:hypothetical protein